VDIKLSLSGLTTVRGVTDGGINLSWHQLAPTRA
jgi:hypothetical protein